MNTISFPARRRQFVLFLLVLHLVYSSAKSFTSTSPASLHRQHQHVVKETQSATALTMVAAIPPRGGAANPISPSVAASNEDKTSRLVKLRQTLFPIHGQHEVTKFLLIGSIKFFIILALTLTRDTKDTLVVTQCGSEAIAFLKVRQQDVSHSTTSLQALTYFFSSIDLWCTPCSHSVHRFVLENGECSQQKDFVLHDVYPVFHIFWAV